MDDLVALLDAAHQRAGEVPPELGGGERVAVESLLREHQRGLGPALRGVWEDVQGWVAASPEPLAHPAPDPSAPWGFGLVPLRVPHLPLEALKRASEAVVAFHVFAWMASRREEAWAMRSEVLLRQVRELVGAPDTAMALRTEGVILEGFVTGLLVGWNLRAVAFELGHTDGAERLRALEPGLLALQQVLASCRKDVFLQLTERLRVDPRDRTAPWRASAFQLGEQLELRPEVFDGLGAAPWPLGRQGCPARGLLLLEVDGWVAACWERYVLTPLDAT